MTLAGHHIELGNASLGNVLQDKLQIAVVRSSTCKKLQSVLD